MKNKLSILILLIAMGLAILPSCKKVSKEIIGTWDVMTFDTKPNGTMRITFDNNSNAIRILDSESGMNVDSCSYEIIKKNLKERIVFRNSKMLPGCDNLNGIYRVDKVKSDMIIATRVEFEEDPKQGGAYYRLELKRRY